jgi:hypothetical protein
MKKFNLIFALAALLAVSSIVALMIAHADEGVGTLAGTVMNAQGKPVPDASVTVQSADGKSPHATRTNAQGRFFFPELPHGLYDVRASHNGWLSEWKHNVNVETGKQVEVALKLTVQNLPSE